MYSFRDNSVVFFLAFKFQLYVLFYYLGLTDEVRVVFSAKFVFFLLNNFMSINSIIFKYL